MKLPFLKKNTEQTGDYYLALLLNDEKATAVVFETIENKIKIISGHTVHFSESIESLELSALIDYIDKAISQAEEVLPPNIETHKTVFGVKENWIEPETKKIKKEYLTRLKKVCDNLDLSPLGFMVVSEAISNLVQQEEGAPLSAILAEIGKHRVDLTLFRGGKIVERINGKVVSSFPEAVDELLKHFTTPVLPARLLISDSDKAEELSQQFIAFQWSKSLPFLHMPQVTVLPNSFDAKSIVFGAAQQMGFDAPEIIHDIKLKSVTPTTPIPTAEVVPTHQPSPLVPHQETAPIPHTEEKIPSTLPVNPFGFVMEKDIALLSPEELPAEKKTYHTESLQPVPQAHHVMVEHHELSENVVEETEDAQEEDNQEKRYSPAGMKKMFAAIHLPKIVLPSLGKGGLWLKLGIPLLILILLFAGAAYFYLYKVKATVVLSVSPKMVQQSADVTFSTSAGNDFSKNTIAAKSVSTSVDGTLSETATGSKDVGNRAKGTVTIYNNSDSSQDLSSGAQIKSSTGVIFTLDKAVTVASASGDIFSGTKPGTTDVPVTANDIGTEYNLPSGTQFSLSNSLAAKNGSAFSGGSKKTVTVISKNDIAKLKTDLTKQLEQNASDKLTQQTSGSETVLPIVLDQSLSKTSFNGNVGDQATKVQINGTVTFSGMSYNTDDLTQFAQSTLKDKYSQNITFSDNSVKETVNNAKQKNSKEVSASLDIQAGLLPKIDTDNVLQQLQGKSVADAKETLMHLPQVSKTEITFSPPLPFITSFLPKLPKQVSVEIKPDTQ